jgi:hypothetical protein
MFIIYFRIDNYLHETNPQIRTTIYRGLKRLTHEAGPGGWVPDPGFPNTVKTITIWTYSLGLL